MEKIKSKYSKNSFHSWRQQLRPLLKKESFVNVDFDIGFGISSLLILTMLILYSK
ncbi:hypothetical protein [Romboutsia lituseburensis]|uniref:hypothetical protein n=1 Tax=Romboutsia lituseburensis TaxID=1537 RepID=UPI00215B7584|nr:hypothetical protein [Romboutsia lituseburensis]MCR8747239.1 hypothetical protein [Romboutsia lituseburensis]